MKTKCWNWTAKIGN